MQQQAEARGVRLLVLAAGMRKRRRNSSFYNIKMVCDTMLRLPIFLRALQ